MKKIVYVIVFLFGFSYIAVSQTGEIQGKVVDDKGDPVGFAAVVIVQDEAGLKPTSKGAKTDVNGFFTIKGVNPGTYNLRASFTGKPKVVETGVVVFVGKPTTQNFKLEDRSTTVGTVTVKGRRANPTKIIDVFTPVQSTMTAEQIKDNSVRDANSLAAQTAGVVQQDRGRELNIGGARSEDNVYFVNGVKVTGSAAVPPSAIANLEVITTGVPAKYGDVTGGVINITTKGPSDKLMGSIEGLTSQFLDPYAFNMINATVTGPIIRRKPTVSDFGGDSKTVIKGEPIFGFTANFMYESEGDKFPRLKGNYKVKDAKWDEIRANPYKVSADGKSLISSQELVTMNDLEEISSNRNTATKRLNGTLGFDFKINKIGTNIAVQGRFFNEVYHNYVARYTLFNYENNPRYDATTYNGLVRINTPLYNPNSDKQSKKLFRNATMQIQGDYERSGTGITSDVAGNNPWLTGYIGQFNEILKPNTSLVNNTQTLTKVFYGAGQNDYLEFGPHIKVSNFVPDGVEFIPGSNNTTAAGFTKIFKDLYEKDIKKLNSVVDFANAGALVNGTRANVFIQGVFYPMARVFNQIQKQENDQYRVAGNLNFDLINRKSADLNKHTIEIGFEAEKRYQSVYSTSPLNIWNVANVSVNQHLSVDNDKSFNPLLVMRGGTVRMRYDEYIKQLPNANRVLFNSFDSLIYDKEVSNGSQTTFSKNLRNSLGIDSLTRVNVHSIPVDKFNINMFSQDELLRNNLVSTAEGYDVYGNRIDRSVEFNDFFTEKKNGLYTRKNAPIRPFYGAGYIQDRFQLKDIAFNVGLRVDYFNPVTKSFIDPYVPAGARSIAEATQFTHPSNLDKNTIVYVNNPTNPTKVMGYRNGDQWYDVNGTELNGPEAIKAASGGTALPYVLGDDDVAREKRNMSSETFDPTLVFRDATPSISIMPRLNFSFKIDTNSLLFANFDMLTRRPSNNQANPLDYYNLLVNGSGSIDNPNLKSPKTSSLGIGFKQKLSLRSSLTINFSYREFIDQITISQINGYPNTYNSFANTDFSTVKSITFTYEMRRTSNLRLTTWYMMQFADGTGSSAGSRAGLLAANQGNLRVINPLNFDNRHTLFMDLNYKFPGGSDYNGPSKLKGIFQELSFSVIPRLISGSPYTQQSNVTAASSLGSQERAITLGDVNAGRMPWRFNLNLKVAKDFSFKYGRKPKEGLGIDERRPGSFNIYLQINNVTNSQVLSVYRFTGSADTDGYIGSPGFTTEYNTKEASIKGLGTSFRDLYNVSLLIPDGGSNYALPRIIQLGGLLSF